MDYGVSDISGPDQGEFDRVAEKVKMQQKEIEQLKKDIKELKAYICYEM